MTGLQPVDPWTNDRIDPRIRAYILRQRKNMDARMRELLPPDVLKLLTPTVPAIGGSKSGPPLTWEAMVASVAEKQRKTNDALKTAGVARQYRELLEEEWAAGISALGEGLIVSQHTCPGVDGNTIPLCLIRPAGGARLPCAYYLHGGGMARMSMRDGMHQTWGRLVARQGVAVCMPDFRNSLSVGHESVPEVAKYPAGLNDCYSGLEWLYQNRDRLNISDVCVCGDSGGGNLCLAVALKAKRDSALHLLSSGVFCMSPFIAGSWPQNVTNEGILGVSHIQNNKWGPGVVGGSIIAKTYGIEAYEAKDPLSWPGFASVDDLRGLPRTIISVCECDSLRDEGIIFYRRLLAAGVQAGCREVKGVLHSSELNHVHAVPEVALATARCLADHAANGAALARLPMPSLGRASKL